MIRLRENGPNHKSGNRRAISAFEVFGVVVGLQYTSKRTAFFAISGRLGPAGRGCKSRFPRVAGRSPPGFEPMCAAYSSARAFQVSESEAADPRRPSPGRRRAATPARWEDRSGIPKPFLLRNSQALGLAVPETLMDAIHRLTFSLLMTAPFNPQSQRLGHTSSEIPGPKSAFSRSYYATLRFLFSQTAQMNQHDPTTTPQSRVS
jgi:hypothetical protein